MSATCDKVELNITSHGLHCQIRQNAHEPFWIMFEYRAGVVRKLCCTCSSFWNCYRVVYSTIVYLYFIVDNRDLSVIVPSEYLVFFGPAPSSYKIYLDLYDKIVEISGYF